jgi:hypothetical protein
MYALIGVQPAYTVNRKSQVAIEYYYRSHDQYPQGHVISIHASSQVRLDHLVVSKEGPLEAP